MIFKTARFAAMKDWYETVTDVQAFFVRDNAKAPNWTGANNIAFIRIFSDHPYTQVNRNRGPACHNRYTRHNLEPMTREH